MDAEAYISVCLRACVCVHVLTDFLALSTEDLKVMTPSSSEHPHLGF